MSPAMAGRSLGHYRIQKQRAEKSGRAEEEAAERRRATSVTIATWLDFQRVEETMTEIPTDNSEMTRRLFVRVWVPVDGNPKETMEYFADGAVRMKMFGGLLHMDGSYRFIEDDTIEINWGVSPSPEAEQVIEAVNDQLAQTPEAPQVRVVQRSVLAISVTETELTTLHLEKGRRVGHFRRAS